VRPRAVRGVRDALGPRACAKCPNPPDVVRQHDRGNSARSAHRGPRGNYFRTGNAAKCFNQVDSYVWRRLNRLLIKRKERHLQAADVRKWSRDYFESFGLHRLRGTVRYPEAA
jgi:Group II intron, maturase-specific domain